MKWFYMITWRRTATGWSRRNDGPWSPPFVPGASTRPEEGAAILFRDEVCSLVRKQPDAYVVQLYEWSGVSWVKRLEQSTATMRPCY